MEIRTFIAPLLKWWWLILIAAALAGVSSYLNVRDDPAIYESRATLMTGRPFDNPNPDGSQFFLSQQLASTYAEIAQREPVREAVTNALGLEYLPSYIVRVPAQTQLIEIVVTDTNPARAQAVANEVANQLVLLSPGGQNSDQQDMSAFVDNQLANLAINIEETQEEILTLEAQLGELFSAREIAETQDQIVALQNKLNTLQSIYTGFLSNSQDEAINVLTIVESATYPSTPIGPNSGLTILLSVVLGVVLAGVAAYGIEYLDDSIQSEDDIRQAVGLPLLTALEKNGTNESYTALTLKSPRSPISESFRDLRTRVMFLGFNKPQGSLLVTSAHPFEGKSFTAANLAVVMAQAGYRTVLVDADLRRPKQHEVFELSNEVGLSNLIMEANAPVAPDADGAKHPLSQALEGVIQDTELSGLKVITSGTIPPNPSELIGSNGMILIVEALKEQFDYLILDSSPCLAVTDAILLATFADSVIVVSSANQTSGKNLKKAVARLREVDANVVGVVLNRVPKLTMGRYSYYNSYSSAEGGRDDNPTGKGVKNGIRNIFYRISPGNGTGQSKIGAEQP